MLGFHSYSPLWSNDSFWLFVQLLYMVTVTTSLEQYHPRSGYYQIHLVSLSSKLGKWLSSSVWSPNCVVACHLVINLMRSCCFVNYFTVEFWFHYNVLGGPIPTEIGQLKQLGEHPWLLPWHSRPVALGVGSYPDYDSNDLFCLFLKIRYLFSTIHWRALSHLRQLAALPIWVSLLAIVQHLCPHEGSK
jgi:hypothetical protein